MFRSNSHGATDYISVLSHVDADGQRHVTSDPPLASLIFSGLGSGIRVVRRIAPNARAVDTIFRLVQATIPPLHISE